MSTTLEDIEWVFKGDGFDSFNCYVETASKRYYVVDYAPVPDRPDRILATLESGVKVRVMVSQVHIEGVALTERYERHCREAEELRRKKDD